MANTFIQTRNDKLGPKIVKALEERNFQAFYCPTKAEGLEKALSLIPKDHTVGWGGSFSIQQLGLVDAVYEQGYTVLDRDKAATPQERMAIMRQVMTCDTFLTSTNALTEDGQLVNMDGNGNRVAAMIFGPKSVVIVAGMNKVVGTLQDAYDRVRHYAAPINAQRFEGNRTPCYANGCCGDCKSDDCICSYLVVTRMCRPKNKIKIVLIGEDLGL